MKYKILTSMILFSGALMAFNGVAGVLKPLAIEHTTSIVQRPDGSFDVTCMDGVMEVKTRAEVLGNRMCMHLRTLGGHWTLDENGTIDDMRMCDLDAALTRADNVVVQLQAQFLPPCASVPARTQQCNGLLCNLQLGNHMYSFDFSVNNKLTLVRLDDNLTAVFSGNGGGGGVTNPSSMVRTADVNGVPGILQVSNDNGTSWKPVCDDNFDMNAANVACKEMGYSSAVGFNSDITVAGDEAYGLDDVLCSGNEASLFTCQHTPWGQDDCADTEHVRLTCQ